MATPDPLHLSMRYPTGDPSAVWIATDDDLDFVVVGCSRGSRRRAQEELRKDKRPHFGESGVYLLRGRERTTGAMRLYIGRTANIKSRLYIHDQKLAWWTEVATVIGAADRWEDEELKALEALLYRCASDARRAVLMNVKVPQLPPDLSDFKHAELQDKATDIMIRLIALGFIELGYDDEGEDEETLPEIPQDDKPSDDATHVLASKGRRAYGRLESDGSFTVLAESPASLSETEALSDEVRQLRADLRRKEILFEADGGVLEFKEDFPLSSTASGQNDTASLMRFAKQVVLGSQGRKAGNWEPVSSDS